jgi:hypothetical protein
VKRASYRDAIDFIAQNDSPGCFNADDPKTVSELVSSQLVADVFAVDAIKVGRDVVRRRAALALARAGGAL